MYFIFLSITNSTIKKLNNVVLKFEVNHFYGKKYIKYLKIISLLFIYILIKNIIKSKIKYWKPLQYNKMIHMGFFVLQFLLTSKTFLRAWKNNVNINIIKKYTCVHKNICKYLLHVNLKLNSVVKNVNSVLLKCKCNVLLFLSTFWVIVCHRFSSVSSGWNSLLIYN